MAGAILFDEDPYIYYKDTWYSLGDSVEIKEGDGFWLFARIKCTYTLASLGVTVRLIVDTKEEGKEYTSIPCNGAVTTVWAYCTATKEGTAKAELWMGDLSQLIETKYSWAVSFPALPASDLLCYDATCKEGESVTLKASLAEKEYPFDSIGGKTITFDFEGSSYGSTTNADTGLAQLTIPASLVPAAGTYTFTAKFAGDGKYGSSSCTASLTVSKRETCDQYFYVYEDGVRSVGAKATLTKGATGSCTTGSDGKCYINLPKGIKIDAEATKAGYEKDTVTDYTACLAGIRFDLKKTAECYVSTNKNAYTKGETILIDYDTKDNVNVKLRIKHGTTLIEEWTKTGSGSELYKIEDSDPTGAWAISLYGGKCDVFTTITVTEEVIIGKQLFLVLNPDGIGQAGAIVSVAGKLCTTDSLGYCYIDGLESGKFYYAAASHGDYEPSDFVGFSCCSEVAGVILRLKPKVGLTYEYRKLCGTYPAATSTKDKITNWWKCAFMHAFYKRRVCEEEYDNWSGKVRDDVKASEGFLPYYPYEGYRIVGAQVEIWFNTATFGRWLIGTFNYLCSHLPVIEEKDTVICDFNILDASDDKVTDLTVGVQYTVRAWLCEKHLKSCAVFPLKGCFMDGYGVKDGELTFVKADDTPIDSYKTGKTSDTGWGGFFWTPKEGDGGTVKLAFAGITGYNACESATKTITVYSVLPSDWLDTLMAKLGEGVDAFVSLLKAFYTFFTEDLWKLLGDAIARAFSVDKLAEVLSAIFAAIPGLTWAYVWMVEGFGVDTVKAEFGRLWEEVLGDMSDEDMASDVEALYNGLSDQFVLSSKSQNPRVGVLAVPVVAGVAIIAAAIAGIIGFQAWMTWLLLDNVLGAKSLAVWGAISTKNWELARRANREFLMWIYIYFIGLAVVGGGSMVAIYLINPLVGSAVTAGTGIARGVGILLSGSVLMFYIAAGWALYGSYKVYKVLIIDHLTMPYAPFPDGVENGAGVIKLITDPSGAEISIWQEGDWQPTMTTTPQSLLLPPGEHRFLFHLIDFKEIEWEGEETFTIAKESVLEPEVIELTKVVPVRPPLPESLSATVVGHLDGDTIRVSITNPPIGIPDVFDVRFLGINTPEGSSYEYSCTGLDEPFLVRRLLTPGQACILPHEETWRVGETLYEVINGFIAARLPVGTQVTLKSDGDRQWDDKDPPRFLAVVTGAGVDIGKTELELGYAVCFFYDNNKQIPDISPTGPYRIAEAVATAANIGVWAYKAGMGSIECVSIPYTAVWVYLDDELSPRGKTVSSVFIIDDAPLGTHTVTFKKIVEGKIYSCTTEPFEVVGVVPVTATCEMVFEEIGLVGLIHCISSPSIAQIWLDGILYSPLTFTEGTLKDIPIGEHTVGFKKNGNECSCKVSVVRGVTSEAYCMLNAIYTIKQPTYIYDEGVERDVDAYVWINGKNSEERGPYPLTLPFGNVYNGCAASKPFTYGKCSCPFGKGQVIELKFIDIGWSDTKDFEHGDSYDVTPLLIPLPTPCSCSFNKETVDFDETAALSFFDAPLGSTLTLFSPVGTPFTWSVSGFGSKTKKLDVAGTWTLSLSGSDCSAEDTAVVSPPSDKGDLTIEVYESRDFATALKVEHIYLDGIKISSGASAASKTNLLVSDNPYTVRVQFKETNQTCYADIPNECSDTCTFVNKINIVAQPVTTVVRVCPAHLTAFAANCAATIYAKPVGAPNTEYEEVTGATTMAFGTYDVKFTNPTRETVIGIVTISSTGAYCEAVEGEGTCYNDTTSPAGAVGIYCTSFIIRGLLKSLPTRTVTFESVPSDAVFTILD